MVKHKSHLRFWAQITSSISDLPALPGPPLAEVYPLMQAAIPSSIIIPMLTGGGGQIIQWTSPNTSSVDMLLWRFRGFLCFCCICFLMFSCSSTRYQNVLYKMATCCGDKYIMGSEGEKFAFLFVSESNSAMFRLREVWTWLSVQTQQPLSLRKETSYTVLCLCWVFVVWMYIYDTNRQSQSSWSREDTGKWFVNTSEDNSALVQLNDLSQFLVQFLTEQHIFGHAMTLLKSFFLLLLCWSRARGEKWWKVLLYVITWK